MATWEFSQLARRGENGFLRYVVAAPLIVFLSLDSMGLLSLPVRARGRNGGRPAKMNERQIAQARAMLEDRDVSLGEVCGTFGVSKTTLYRHLSGDSKRKKEAG